MVDLDDQSSMHAPCFSVLCAVPLVNLEWQETIERQEPDGKANRERKNDDPNDDNISWEMVLGVIYWREITDMNHQTGSKQKGMRKMTHDQKSKVLFFIFPRKWAPERDVWHEKVLPWA